MKLFTMIVLVLAGAFSLVMLVVFSCALGGRSAVSTLNSNGSCFGARLLMFFASAANAAIVLLYLLEWNH